MNIGPLFYRLLDAFRIDLPVGARQQKHLGAIGKEFRRAALGRFDVRLFVAENGMI